MCELKIKAFCVILPNAFYATKNLVPNLGHFTIVWMIPSVRRWLKKCPNFVKSSPNSPRAKNAKINYIKAQFESLKHLHQTTFATKKYLQQTVFWNSLFCWKSKNNGLSKKRPKILPFFGYFIFSKNHNKVAQLANIHLIWSLWWCFLKLHWGSLTLWQKSR